MASLQFMDKDGQNIVKMVNLDYHYPTLPPENLILAVIESWKMNKMLFKLDYNPSLTMIIVGTPYPLVSGGSPRIEYFKQKIDIFQ